MRLLSAGTRPGNDLNKCLERYLGIKPAAGLTFDEWRLIPPRLGDAALALGFAIGDWLIFGERFAAQRSLPGFEDMPAKVPHERYEAALLATRLDIGTLQNSAYVARHVPRSVRHELLSFEHHRAVARLDEVEGGIFIRDGGRHNPAAGFIADAEKYLEAFLAGWNVVRLTEAQITAPNFERIIRRVRFDMGTRAYADTTSEKPPRADAFQHQRTDPPPQHPGIAHAEGHP